MRTAPYSFFMIRQKPPQKIFEMPRLLYRGAAAGRLRLRRVSLCLLRLDIPDNSCYTCVVAEQ